MFKDYLAEIFEPTLLLAFLTSLVGVAAAAHNGSINSGLAAMAVIGSVLAQMSVNLINDYHDFATGMDKESTKTKFSGGSRFVSSGAVSHKHVLYIGTIAALVAGLLGLYLAVAVNLLLLVLIAVGAISIFLYTKYILKFPLLPEPFVMLAFSLVAVGTYIVASGSLANLNSALFVFVPAGVLSGLALLVNEVPDAEIDKKYGRKHSVIVLNSEKKVAAYYLLLMLATYASVIYAIMQGAIGYFSLVVLVTLPAVLYVTNGILHYKNPQSYEKYMATNALSAFIYLILLVIAYSV